LQDSDRQVTQPEVFAPGTRDGRNGKLGNGGTVIHVVVEINAMLTRNRCRVASDDF